MLTISTITEALAELSKQTGRTWTESELFDVATHRGLELHAAPPIGAKTTIEKYVDGVGVVQTIPKMPADFDYLIAPFVNTNHPSRLAVVFPSEVEQLWLRGEVFVRHSHRYNEVEDENIVFFGPVRVTRELVRIKASTLEKIVQIWNDAQAGRWIADAKQAGAMKRQKGPDWLFPTEQASPAQTTTTPSLKAANGNWIERAQTEARKYVKEQTERDLYPSQEAIGDWVANKFRQDGVVGSDGKPLSGTTIKRHALKGISSAKGKLFSATTKRGK